MSARTAPRTHRGVTGLVLVLLGALAAASARLFVWPSSDRPAPADAVVVFGGDGARLAKGIQLVSSGVAPVLAVSAGSGFDPCYRLREPPKVLCFQPRPRSTRGEARWLEAAAAARGWHRVVLVVSGPQAVRARMRVRRCYSGGVQVVAVHLGAVETVADAVYEWGALFKALTFQRGC